MKLSLCRYRGIVDITLLALCIATCIFYFYISINSHGFGHDMDVYKRGVIDYNLGQDPYRTDVDLIFVYPPVLLHTFLLIDKFVRLEAFMLLCYIAITLWFSFELSKFFNKDENKIDYVLTVFYAFSFAALGPVSIASYNFTPFLHLLVLTSTLIAHRKNTFSYKALFCFALLISSVLKPYFLAYSIIPFFWNNKKREKIGYIASIYTLFLFVYACMFIFLPHESHAFLNSLNAQIILKNDLGYSFFLIFKILKFSNAASLLAHAFCSIISLLVAIFALPKLLNIRKDSFLMLLLLFFTLIIINPRMKDYDFTIAVICLFTFIHKMLYPHHKLVLALGVLISFIPTIGFISTNLNWKLPKMVSYSFFWQWVAMVCMGAAFLYLKKTSNRGNSGIT